MELLKSQDNLTFEYEDVKFFVRPSASVKDRFEVDMVGDWKDGKFEMKKTAYFLKLVELFVVGWSGVTQDGKEVAYSYETLLNSFPNVKNDLILTLGAFIASKVGILPESEPKKGD
jgi:hypothetical protein